MTFRRHRDDADASAEPLVPSEPLLELRGITAAYGRIQVLHGVELAVPEGSVFALLGPNGAGKTTTLGGHKVNGARPEDLARRGLCTVPEGRGVFPNLTVRENLQMATFSGVALEKIETIAYDRFPRLGERRNQLTGTMSGGEQQMLAMARALATDPALLLLDELSMGLAPLVVAELYQLVAELAETGVSILVVEQFARTVLGVADLAAIMVNGRVTRVGAPGDLEEELSAAYLGASS